MTGSGPATKETAGQDDRGRSRPVRPGVREHGFWSALGVYRNLDKNWHEHLEIGATGVKRAAIFISERRDPAVIFGKLKPMEVAVPSLRRIALLPNCGHWTQERPLDVDEELMDGLRRERPSRGQANHLTVSLKAASRSQLRVIGSSEVRPSD